MTDNPPPQTPASIEAARAEIEYLGELYRHHKALADAAKRRRDALRALVGEGERVERG